MNARNGWVRLGLFLLLVFFMLSLYAWRTKICFNPDELFYYKSSQTLSEFRNVFAPAYFGEHRFQKPPFFYTAVFLSFKLFGVNWFSARVVTVFSSILVLLMTYLFGKKMFDREKAFFGTAVLATSMLFFRFGRIVLPEMTLIFFMMGALYFAYRAFLENNRGSFYLSFLFMAIGTFVKGPIAFLFPGLVVLIFQVTSRKETSPVSVPWVRGIGIVLGLNLLWLVPTFIIYGKEYLDHIVAVEMGNRLTEEVDLYGFRTQVVHYVKNLFFYVPIIFAEYLPWSVLGPVALFAARGKLDAERYFTQRRFLLIWFWTGFLIYTLVPAKRHHYVLTLFPALSLYLVSYLDFGWERVRKMFRFFLSITMAGYFFALIIIFPHIFSDGVDRLSIKLSDILNEKDAPVAVSWRLDPQEIEFHIDRSSHIIWEAEFTELEPVRTRIGDIFPKAGEDDYFFYLLLAEREYDEYLEGFIRYMSEVTGGPVTYSEFSRDWRWRKTIKFGKFLRNTVEDPGMIKEYFNDAFKEDVLLITVRKE